MIDTWERVCLYVCMLRELFSDQIARGHMHVASNIPGGYFSTFLIRTFYLPSSFFACFNIIRILNVFSMLFYALKTGDAAEIKWRERPTKLPPWFMTDIVVLPNPFRFFIIIFWIKYYPKNKCPFEIISSSFLPDIVLLPNTTSVSWRERCLP